MKLTEILLERRGYYAPHYNDEDKRQVGYTKDWLDQLGVTQADIDQAIVKAKQTKAFKDLIEAGFKYDGTKRTEKNGTLRFALPIFLDVPAGHRKRTGERWYQIMANGLIRQEDETKGVLKGRGPMKSPKTRVVPGNAVKSLVRTYETAMEELAKKKVRNKAVREALNPRGNLKEDDTCPSCKKGVLEAGRVRDSSMPDADWLQCSDCDFQTDPE